MSRTLCSKPLWFCKIRTDWH